MPYTSGMDQPVKALQCMEVWGGYYPVNSGVIMPGLDAWVYSQPAGGVEQGGDVHYVSSCAAGQIVRMLVADVAGHGAEVSTLAGRLRGLMRRHIISHDQRKLVISLNRDFAAASAAGRFATALIMTFMSQTNHLQVANAGHPPPLWYRRRESRWRLMDAAVADATDGNIPLGIEETDYREFSADLGVGDLVLCYTDALIEACDANDEPLGTAGLLAIARELDLSDPATVVPQLLSKIDALRPGNLSADDTTVLMFRPNGLRQRVPLRDRLLAPFRYLCGLFKR